MLLQLLQHLILRRQAVRLCPPLKWLPPHLPHSLPSPSLRHCPPLKEERLPAHASKLQLLQHLMLRRQAVRLCPPLKRVLLVQ